MQGSSYTDDIRRQAVVLYQVCGNLNKVERELNIPHTTLQDWKRSEWWDAYTLQIQHQVKDQVVADTTRTYQKYIAALEDRVDNGDEVMTRDGPQRVKVKARDAAVTASILFGQRQILLNQPTSITSGQGLTDIASKLVEAFQAIVERNRTVQDAERVTDLLEVKE